MKFALYFSDGYVIIVNGLKRPVEVRGIMKESESKYTKEKLLKREIFSWIKIIVLALIIAFVLNNFVIINAKVDSGSMENTLMTNSRAFGFRFSYWFSDPERYDVVVFRYPDDESQKYVKRIIGLPGEKVEIIDGKIFIDGSSEPLEDDFVSDEYWDNRSYGPYEVPQDSYFLMGDARNNSKDSRAWVTKFVTKKKILGKVLLTYWPDFELME